MHSLPRRSTFYVCECVFQNFYSEIEFDLGYHIGSQTTGDGINPFSTLYSRPKSTIYSILPTDCSKSRITIHFVIILYINYGFIHIYNPGILKCKLIDFAILSHIGSSTLIGQE